MAERTCEALAPHSCFSKCGNPVVGRSDKRYCSRTCQNREQKASWRANNRIADIGLRLNERRKRRLREIEQDEAEMRAYAEDFLAKHPAEAAWVEDLLASADIDDLFTGWMRGLSRKYGISGGPEVNPT